MCHVCICVHRQWQKSNFGCAFIHVVERKIFEHLSLTMADVRQFILKHAIETHIQKCINNGFSPWNHMDKCLLGKLAVCYIVIQYTIYLTCVCVCVRAHVCIFHLKTTLVVSVINYIYLELYLKSHWIQILLIASRKWFRL